MTSAQLDAIMDGMEWTPALVHIFSADGFVIPQVESTTKRQAVPFMHW